MGAVGVTWTVRPATRRDRDAIATLARRTIDEHRVRFPDHFGDVNKAEQRIDLILARRSKSVALVAEEDGRVIGWTAYTPFEIPASQKRHDILGLVIDLTVEEAARGKGVGTALINDLVERAKQKGITYLHADVWHGSPSSSVLSRAGIVPVKMVHELRLADRRKGPPRTARIRRFAEILLLILTIILIAILLYEMLAR